MPSIDVKDLDGSPMMMDYFQEVTDLLVTRHGKTPQQARDMVGVYFADDVDPLERALTMHENPALVAEDFARA